jgi:uncharacterized membrane protein
MAKTQLFIITIGILTACSKDKTPTYSCHISSIVSYQSTIKPIIQSKCNNCHNYPGVGGIYLDSFQMLHDLVINGSIYGVIHSQPNYVPMPPAGSPLFDSCELANIDNWIAQGALNN